MGPVSVVGVGIDVVDVARARAMLERQGDRLLARTLTAEERAYVLGAGAPAEALAARLAAKEAGYKALQALPGARGVSWQDLEVVRDGNGRPSLALHGLAARLVAEAGPLAFHLSLTHSHTTAAAVVVAERVAAAGG